jgi:hypothetical protein
MRAARVDPRGSTRDGPIIATRVMPLYGVPGARSLASLRERYAAAADVVSSARDLLDARPRAGDAPEPLRARGWATYLAALDDSTLDALEASGHDATWPDDAPPSLRAMIDLARDVCALPPLVLPAPAADPRVRGRGEGPRKGAQVDAFARMILPLAGGASRVVDVGSGHGHLTRAIASRIARPVVGLERDPSIATRARSLSPPGTGASPAPPLFAVTDVVRDGLVLSAGELVIGLHACGELGDAIVVSAARAGASVALVGCCLQKRRAASRATLAVPADAPALAASLDLPTPVLGLSNVTARDRGVEATRAENLAARERRLALHRLLGGASSFEALGAEIRGLNRRAAHGDLGALVARAFALRGLAAPAARAIADAASWARVEHARIRRMSLPRDALARAVEVFVLLDRARHLEESGLQVTVGELFPTSVSARNLALLAAPGP